VTLDLFTENLEEKKPLNRYDLEKMLREMLNSMTLKEFVLILTNKFTAVIDYYDLMNGDKTSQRTSLLFNPHRLDIKTKTSKYSIFEGMKNDSYISGISRAIIWKRSYETIRELLYLTIQVGINGIQYINEFPPHVARDLYKQFGLTKNSQILDPCAGWGGRMIGASIVSDNYTCFEPATQTYEGLIELNKFIHSMNSTFHPNIYCSCFEDSNLQDNYYDFALTSPPYYDTEEYTDEKTNSLNRYNSFESWSENFYIPLIEKTMKSIKPNGSFVINIGSRKYPLNSILMSNFENKYEITKLKDKLKGKEAGIRDNENDGEAFYRIKKGL